MELTPDILSYIALHTQEAKELLLELAPIPAPSHQEHRRAEFCANWLRKQGAENVYIDDALNVIYPVGCEENNTIAVFMAHSDVVFPDTTPLPLSISNGRIYCPGVGDDTANVVALLMAAKYIAENKLQPKNHGVLLVINSCEEGLGNLKGCRKIMEDFGCRVKEFVTFDGSHKQIVNRAVGSRRYQIEIRTEGGHSYANFGNRNAIALLASLIDRLYSIEVPKIGKTTYNVGTISGGTSVNTIAQYAQMLFEFRSDEKEALNIMEQKFREILAEFSQNGIHADVTLVGDRPCSDDIDPGLEKQMNLRAAKAVKTHFCLDPDFASGSTDCNIPLSMGINALCVGCAETYGAHTREEYVEISSLKPGLGVAFELILHYF